jgi:hypothetical protein
LQLLHFNSTWKKPRVVEIAKRAPCHPGAKTAREELLTL